MNILQTLKPLEKVPLNTTLLKMQMFFYCISCFWIEAYKSLLEIMNTMSKKWIHLSLFAQRVLFLVLKMFSSSSATYFFLLFFLIANTRCITNRPLHNVGSSFIYFSCSCGEGDNRGYCKYLIAVFWNSCHIFHL